MTTKMQVASATYVHAMLRAFEPGSVPGRRLTDWLRYNYSSLGIDFDAAVRTRSANGRLRLRPPAEKALSNHSWAQLTAATGQAASRLGDEADLAGANLEAFATAIELAPGEAAILRFVFHLGRDKSFDWLCDNLVGTKMIDSLGLLSLCLGQTTAELWAHLTRGQLARLQLIQVSGDGQSCFGYYLPYRLSRALLPPNDGLDAIERSLIGHRQSARLDLANYDHMAPIRDFLRRLLEGALEGRHLGVNILLHGEPGTGKTEFCRSLAAALDSTLYAVGEADCDGDEMDRSERLDALRLADRLSARRGRTLLLFDEMEDVLQSGDRVAAGGRTIRRAGSKVFFNRLLETNAVPVLWTTNAIAEFDPAFLRRMTFVCEMKRLPAMQRRKLWQGVANGSKLELNDEEASQLARRHDVVPSVIAGAIAAVTMAGGAKADIDLAINATANAADNRRHRSAGRFEVELVNADMDLGQLTQSLSSSAAPRDVSFCFYGPPGTGKSAYARELAERMRLEPMVKRGSDLLSKWVGGTERNLAAAFDEATQDRAFLIIDEADNLLWRRDGANQSWEVSMVNELLQQMECHALPFACTTNHLDSLDPAALRRFDFKVKFDFLTDAQLAHAYQQFFGRRAPDQLRRLRGLTPGDFAVVARKARVLNLLADDKADLVGLLARETDAKNLPRRIGF